ncbi:MAG: zinc-ribbon domain-containing protein [Deltaproteobacteria bacterium]|nr:zinc-ribbon domain-containing protein [Deltaproteobacteria bacterium]
MLVFCEECGKRYAFPPEEMTPGSNTFRCRECGFLMTVALAGQTGKKGQGESGLKPGKKVKKVQGG